MSSAISFWKNTPREDSGYFLLGVFFIFSTVGLASDISQMDDSPAKICAELATSRACFASAMRRRITLRTSGGKGAFHFHRALRVDEFCKPGCSRRTTGGADNGFRDGTELQNRLGWECTRHRGGSAWATNVLVYASYRSEALFPGARGDGASDGDPSRDCSADRARLGQYEFYGARCQSGEWVGT